MTDREAIRRLAAAVARYAERNGMGQLRSEVMELISNLAEPAAPTDEPEVCGCSGCETHRNREHFIETVRELGGSREPAAPTVTREQAASVLTIVRQAIALARLECHREGNAKSERFFYEMGQALERSEPAFFRAVADALDREG